ncbi:unnamed protein product [Closterium sp. Naga37s-1]|nr:unnamed protein product [Closterium sp. Naga37s-1]
MATGMYMDTRLQQQFWGYGGYSQRDLYEPPPPIPNPSPPIGRLSRPPLLVIPPIVPAPLTPTPVALMREIERYNRKKNAERAERLAADRPAGPPVRPRRRRVWDYMFFDLPPTPPPRRASAPAAPVTHVALSEPLLVLTASTAPAPNTANTAINTAPAPVVRASPLQPLKELNGTLPPPLPLPLSASNVLVPVDGKAARSRKLLPERLLSSPGTSGMPHAAAAKKRHREPFACSVDLHALGSLLCSCLSALQLHTLGESSESQISEVQSWMEGDGTAMPAAVTATATGGAVTSAGLKDMLLVQARAQDCEVVSVIEEEGGEVAGWEEIPVSLRLQPQRPLSPLAPLQSPLSAASVQALPPLVFQPPLILTGSLPSEKVLHPGRRWSPSSVLASHSPASDTSS